MSRRREAAELARALQISTQEAISVSRISPHTLSSSDKSTTQDSKEMELRIMQAQSVRPGFGVGIGLGGVSTVRPGDIMGPPIDDLGSFSSASISRSSNDVNGFVHPTTGKHSTINSFTPSRSDQNPNSHNSNIPRSVPQAQIMIPLSSMTTHHTQPQLVHGPSFGYVSPVPNFPMNRLSSTENPSETSSHRPVFSPTQGSGAYSVHSMTGLPPKVQTTYGRKDVLYSAFDNQPIPSRPSRQFRVSSSPPSDIDSDPQVKLPTKRQIIELSSDDEAEEPVETSKQSKQPDISNRSVVSVNISPRRSSRHSPDPLDCLTSLTTPLRPSRPPVAKASAAGPSSSRTPAPPSTAASSIRTSQQSISNTDGSSRRISKRVIDAQAKKEAEKEERRRKRREEKEKKAEAERLKEEREKAKQRQSEKNKAERAPSRVSSRAERSSRRHEATDVEAIKEPDRERREEPAAQRDLPELGSGEDPTQSDETEEATKAPVEGDKKRKGAQEDDDDRRTSIDLSASATLNKRRKRIVEEEDDDISEKMLSVNEDENDEEMTEASGKKAAKAESSKKNHATKVEGKNKHKGTSEKKDSTTEVSIEQKDNATADDLAENGDGDENTRTPPTQNPDSFKETTLPPARPISRSPLKATSSNVSVPSHRPSPGPMKPNGTPIRPGGIQWRTSRSDLSSVLAKFPGSRTTGMSKKLRIAPLHTKIGPPPKALPPVPQKPVKKKKGEESDDDDEEDEENEDDDSGSEDENGQKKVKKNKGKVKGMEWFMVED